MLTDERTVNKEHGSAIEVPEEIKTDEPMEIDVLSGEESCNGVDECEEKVNYRQFVLFKDCDELYGAPIELVFEILKQEDTKIARMPNTKDYVLGLINLRGEIIPAIHMGKRFGTGCRSVDSKNRIIVFNCNDSFIGLAVDSVEDILQIEEDKVVKDFVKKFAIGNRHIDSVIYRDTEIIGVLDISSLNI